MTLASKGSKINTRSQYLNGITKAIEDAIDGIQEEQTDNLTELTQKLLRLASMGAKTEKKYQYLLEMTEIMEEEMKAIDDEEDDDTRSQAQSNNGRSITNGVLEGGESSCSITIQNPEKVKSKGRPKGKTREKTIVETEKH